MRLRRHRPPTRWRHKLAFSLGLALYNFGQRRTIALPPSWPVRPAGSLVWLHAPDGPSHLPMAELARRLIEEDGISVLLSSHAPTAGPEGCLICPPPADNPEIVRAFLDHWRPDIAAFAGGELRPALQAIAKARGLPMILLEGGAPRLPDGRSGWFPGLLRATLQTFRHLAAVDEAAARALRKAGALPETIEVAGRMEETSAALPYLEAEREALAHLFATRPIWLAADVPEAEEAAVIRAHHAALRLAHRLLLIFVPQDPARAEAIATRMRDEEGWDVALRAHEDEPDPETQVYIADGHGEYGLWYRLAPVTFLGGSLGEPGEGPRNPMEPAALGSAILFGPRLGHHDAAFQRLVGAGAALGLADATALPDALTEMLAPDRSALLAAAAWDVASAGAEVTDRALARIRRLLDGGDA